MKTRDGRKQKEHCKYKSQLSSATIEEHLPQVSITNAIQPVIVLSVSLTSAEQEPDLIEDPFSETDLLSA